MRDPLDEVGAGSRAPGGGPAAAVDLDLAFSAAEELSPELLQAAGVWLDPLQAEAHWQGLLAGWLGQLSAELPEELRSGAYSAGLSLVADAEIAALNADWRDKAGPTDVLAFAAQDEGLDEAPPMPLPGWAVPVGLAAEGAAALAADAAGFEPEGMDAADHDPEPDADPWDAGVEPLELGDIVISVETAARQAPEHGHDLARELLFLASHGLLHLLGWDHPDEDSLAAMLARQEALLAAWPAEPSARA